MVIATWLRRLLALLFLLQSAAALALPGIYLDAPDYYRNVDTRGLITFSAPGAGIVASDPQFCCGDQYTFYNSISYGGVDISRTSANSNKPGLSYTDQYPVYAASVSSALVPGLGRFSNDDGVLIDFSRLGGVSAFGANFGTALQTPSPCCVQQWAIVSYMDGGSDLIDLVAKYGFERAATDLISLSSPNRLIRSVELNQLGHNPIIDNISWGRAFAGGPTLAVAVQSNQGKPRVVLASTGSDDEQALADLKSRYGTQADRFGAISNGLGVIPPDAIHGPAAAAKGLIVDQAIKAADTPDGKLGFINRMWGALRSARTGIADYFLGSTQAITAGYSSVYRRLENDPPRANFTEPTGRSGVTFQAGFAAKFGPQYAVADTYFANLGDAVESLELALVSIEKAQGALLAGDAKSKAMQESLAGAYLTSADLALGAAKHSFADVINLFNQEGIDTSSVRFVALAAAQQALRDDGIDPDLYATLMALGFTHSELDHFAQAALGIDATTASGPQSFSQLVSQLDALASDSMHANLLASAVPEPASLAAGLLGLAMVAACVARNKSGRSRAEIAEP